MFFLNDESKLRLSTQLLHIDYMLITTPYSTEFWSIFFQKFAEKNRDNC
jgi:hypothetical protein